MLATVHLAYLLTGVLTLLYSFSVLISMVSFLRLKVQEPSSLIPSVSDLPVVTIQLPVYNEKRVIHRLLEAVSRLDYPRDRFEIRILDDSRDETSLEIDRKVAHLVRQGFDICVLRRKDRIDYKTGALRQDFEAVKGEFITVFDADFVPPTDFLKKILPYFAANPSLGFVQARWGYLNDRQSTVTMLQAIGLDIHFILEKPVEQQVDLFINYNGSGAVWRRQAILDAGGWPKDALSEDLEISYRAQLNGWKALYLPDVVVLSELPPSLYLLGIQQERWAAGAIKVLRKLWYPILSAKMRPARRFHALSILSGYAIPSLFVIQLLLLVPLVAFLRPSSFPALATIAFLTLTLANAVISQRILYSDWKQRSLYAPLFGLFSIGLAIRVTRGVLAGFLSRTYTFTRTPKYGLAKTQGARSYKSAIKNDRGKDWWIEAALEMAVAAYALVGCVLSYHHAFWPMFVLLLLYTISFASVSIKTTGELISGM